MRRVAGIAIALTAVAAIAGCSSGSSGGSAAPQPTATVTVTQTPSATPKPTPSATPTTGAANLFLTPTIRAALIHARAQEEKLPDSAYTSLAKGTAYYALDRTTGTYWAAGSTVPSPHSIRAEVSSQDEGGYLLFEMKPGGPWTVYDVGLDGPGPREGSACPVKVPADVLAVWHWKPNSCDPTFNP